MAPALALKGLGAPVVAGGRNHALALGLMALAGSLAWAPPVGGIPLAAYVSVGLLLVGGIAALPLAVGALLNRIAPLVAARALPLLAVERSRRLRETAAVATSGVVASLALSVALTVMVASFRDSVTQWLDGVLPAQLYVRAASVVRAAGWREQHLAARSGARHCHPARRGARRSAAHHPAAARTQPARRDPAGAPLAHGCGHHRPDAAAGGQPGAAAGAPRGETVVPVYVSEAMVDLYGARPGGWLPELARPFPLPEGVRFFVAGVWRDYARQHGSVVMDRADYVRFSGDERVNDLALHLTDGASEAAVREAIRALAANRVRKT